MSRYSFVVVFLLLLYAGCSAKSIKVDDNTRTRGGQVTSASADFYYLMAVDCELQKDYVCSQSMFEKLYELTKQSGFLKESVRFALLLGKYDAYKKHIKDIEKMAETDSDVASFLIPYYTTHGDFARAKESAKRLLKKSPSLENYQLLSALYMDAKEYKKAERVLQEYVSEYGCQIKICSLLLLVKTKQNDTKGALEILRKLYKKTDNKLFETQYLKLLVSLGKYDELERYVDNSKELSKEILVDVYSSIKRYKKAEKISLELYHEKKDLRYLADSAIFLYEGEYKKDKRVLKKVLKRFHDSVDRVKDALYYNYYGYLLIDHDVDVKRGIVEVKKALKLKPKSEYYLDSLAWGYFKLGKCKEALDILDALKDKEQEEIKEHIKKAKECLKR